MAQLNSDNRAMPYRNLGGTGLMVSALSFGTMTLSDTKPPVEGKISRGEEAYELIEKCYRGGVNLFDCAEVYGGGGSSERVLGECIQTGIARGVWGRSDLVITTKIFGGGRGSLDTINSIGLSRKHLFEGLKDSLARLQLEYVDLVFCHRPDPRTPLEEVVRGMNHVIDQGMAFYWGTSEWPAAMIAEATGIADRLGLVPPYFDQSHYNMLVRQRVESDYLPLYPQLGLTVWSPLAGGKLTDRTHRSAHEGRAGDELLETVTALAEIATELRCTTAQLALAWTIANTNVSTAIFGASSLAQLEDNLGALEVLPKLTPDVLGSIDKVLENKPALGYNPAFRTTAAKM